MVAGLPKVALSKGTQIHQLLSY